MQRVGVARTGISMEFATCVCGVEAFLELGLQMGVRAPSNNCTMSARNIFALHCVCFVCDCVCVRGWQVGGPAGSGFECTG